MLSTEYEALTYLVQGNRRNDSFGPWTIAAFMSSKDAHKFAKGIAKSGLYLDGVKMQVVHVDDQTTVIESY